MMIKEKDERLIERLMDKSSVEMPFSDFEDQLMKKINAEVKRSHSFHQNMIPFL